VIVILPVAPCSIWFELFPNCTFGVVLRDGLEGLLLDRFLVRFSVSLYNVPSKGELAV